MVYDQETGFGLVQALGALDLPGIDLGDSARAGIGDAVVLAGGRNQRVRANIVSKQEFAGYWEYLLDEAIFTAPAHPLWGGAGLFDLDGKLLGIGSLLLQAGGPDGAVDINMVVPINLLPPILDDLLNRGQVRTQARPWLGLYSAETAGKVVVLNVDERGPGKEAGLQAGDVISEVRDQSIDGLADFYRKVWDTGPPGTEIPLRVLRDNREKWMRVRSADRGNFLKKPVLQ
jgi:S1-C subfamily serine protease